MLLGYICVLVLQDLEFVTLSTKEAEYVAMADGVKEALYLSGVLVFSDAQSGVDEC